MTYFASHALTYASLIGIAATFTVAAIRRDLNNPQTFYALGILQAVNCAGSWLADNHILTAFTGAVAVITLATAHKWGHHPRCHSRYQEPA